MFLNKLKAVSLALLLLGAVSGGVGAWARWMPVEPRQPIQDRSPRPSVVSKEFIKEAPAGPRPITATSSFIVNPFSPKDTPNMAPFDDPIPGQQVIPIASTDTIALAYRGKAIAKVAAYSAYTGEWSSHELVNPVQGSISPVIGPGSAIYQVGNDFYAFSAPAGKWDLLRLPADAKASALTSEQYIRVHQGNRLYVFGIKIGKWSKGVSVTPLP